MASSQVSLVGGNTVAYNLCGINDSAKDCSIGVGKLSTDRLLLLRRETLELALYTFKYIGATNNVPGPLPPTVAQMAEAPEAPLVREATARGLFVGQVQQAQDGSNVMVLAPLPAR